MKQRQRDEVLKIKTKMTERDGSAKPENCKPIQH